MSYSVINDKKLVDFTHLFLQVAKKATVLKRRKSNETRKSQKLEENARNASIQSTNGAGNCEIETEEPCFNEMESNVSSKQGKFLSLNFQHYAYEAILKLSFVLIVPINAIFLVFKKL